MARGLRLTAWISAVVMAGVLAAPQITAADDTTVTTKTGIDAKAAFARIKTLAGTWKSETIDAPKAEHGDAKDKNHKADDSVTYKQIGRASCRERVLMPV